MSMSLSETSLSVTSLSATSLSATSLSATSRCHRLAIITIITVVATLATLLPGSSAGATHPDIRVGLRVYLEGALEPGSNLMRTDLYALGLLPTADPYGSGDTLDVNNPTPQRTPVDWVRVEVREASDPGTVVTEFSGIVRADGAIVQGSGQQIRIDVDPHADYHVVVFHKSSLPVASPAIPIRRGDRLVHNFGRSDTGPFFGAHQVEPLNDGRWAMIAGNPVQDTAFDAQEINGLDVAAWSIDNGDNDVYLPTDFNLDGDVNGADKILQQSKSGLFVAIPF